ncbi:alpha kinase/elongation factor 2 kinase [Anaeramoeba flamelloides]|uniref:Alpha kinase/elongation factor 2 kinase n=1 Tax=Anaeramoeba flamelloides TaxID=1746091 RepID=A0AAV7Z259_9EUKA|nr:alpha kinase/elongation factor 2 kinase [Anaeramoeba flamelloides]
MNLPLVYDSTINYGNSNNNKKIELVCAIDFGTCRTGAAWMKKKSRNERLNIALTDIIRIYLDPQDQNFKTTTSILFQKDNQNKWEPISFGKSAESEYWRRKQQNNNNCEFFKNFKMKLYQNNSINPKIQSYSGVEWEIIEVLSGLFQFINKKFVESVKKYYKKKKYNLDKEKIQWVLTVPAIWEDQAKEIMRRAFYKAGLISSKDSANLLFCYEPEVAAIDFFQDQKKKIKYFNNKKLLVVDAGGGTIDITLMKSIIKNNKIEEFEILMVPKGGDFGSIYIDQQFMKFFQSFLNLNDNQFNQFKNECPRGFLRLENIWEGIKIGIQEKEMTKNDSHLFEPPRIVLRYLKKRFGIKNFEHLADQFNQRNRNSGLSEIEWDDDEDQLIIYGDRIQSFFEEPIDKSKKYLNNLKQKSEILKQTDIVFFTGGLSNSEYFRKSVQKILGNNYQYNKAPYPDKSIIIGAVLFGFDPNIVSTRRSQFTYGILHTPIFNPQIHDQNRKIVIRNSNNQQIEYCQNVFQPYIFREDKIKLSEPIIEIFTPIKKNLKEMKIYILRTEKQWDPNCKSIYFDSQGVKIMGSVIIPIPKSNLSLNKQKLEVSFHYATTEIKIFMKYLPDPTIQKHLSLNYDQSEGMNKLFDEESNNSLHTVLLIDISGSMKKDDVKPTNEHTWLQNKYNNRLGAVFEAVIKYINQRKDLNPNDRFSLITYSIRAGLKIKNQPLDPDLIETNCSNLRAANGTNIYKAFDLAISTLNQINLKNTTPRIILFSDGADGGINKVNKQLNKLMKSNIGTKIGLTIYSVGFFGKQSNFGEDMLKLIAKIGKGQYHETVSLQNMVETFIKIAKN